MTTSTFGTGRPVVVGIDGSELSTLALAWGVDEARRRSSPLRLVHAADRADETAGAEMLDTAAGRARGAVPDLDVRTVLDSGRAAEALLKQASDADVVVLGSGIRGRFASLHESTTRQVAMHAPCAVVVIRLAGEDAPPGPSAGRVVVAVDDSARSRPAIDFAFEQAAGRGINLTAVLSWLGPDIDPDVTPPHEWEHAADDEQALLSRTLAEWCDRYPDVGVVEKAVLGEPTGVLVDESRSAELIVVGSHGRGRFGAMMHGSISQDLLHRAHCPVAVVRTGDAGVPTRSGAAR